MKLRVRGVGLIGQRMIADMRGVSGIRPSVTVCFDLQRDRAYRDLRAWRSTTTNCDIWWISLRNDGTTVLLAEKEAEQDKAGNHATLP